AATDPRRAGGESATFLRRQKSASPARRPAMLHSGLLETAGSGAADDCAALLHLEFHALLLALELLAVLFGLFVDDRLAVAADGRGLGPDVRPGVDQGRQS